jgi:hypothetical protein
MSGRPTTSNDSEANRIEPTRTDDTEQHEKSTAGGWRHANTEAGRKRGGKRHDDEEAEEEAGENMTRRR